MSACTAWDDAILDAALGQTPSDPLRRHLVACAGCRDELARRQALAQRLDVAVETLVRREPPASLGALASRLRDVPALTARRSTLALSAWAALAAATIALLFIVRALSPSGSPSDAAAVTRWQSPTSSLLEWHVSVRSRPPSLPEDSRKTHSLRTIPIGERHVT
jgi:anti-sigma factor RsiW